MAFTYDLSSDVGKIRLMLPDRDADNAIFSDEELAAFLSIESSSVRRATALALETIATDEALVLKVITLLDVQTDGSKLANSLLGRAAKLRDQAQEDEARDSASLFDYAEMAFSPFGIRERIYNQYLRNGS